MDAVILAANFGYSASEANSVPEPGTGALLALGLGLAGLLRGRSSPGS